MYKGMRAKTSRGFERFTFRKEIQKDGELKKE